MHGPARRRFSMLTCEDLAFSDLLLWAKNGQNELVRRVHKCFKLFYSRINALQIILNLFFLLSWDENTHTLSLTHTEMHRSTHLIVFLRSWLWSRGLMESVVWVVDLFKLLPLSEALNVFYFGETCSSGLSLWHFSSFRAWVCFWWTERREGKNGFDYNQERETSVSSSGKEDDNQEEKGSLPG